jgi:hypothetical protein
MKYTHNQIQTDNNEIEIGRNYSYFEDSDKAIACVEILEDNSTDELISFKLKVIKSFNAVMQEGEIFNCSALHGNYSYQGMWIIKNFNIANVFSALSPSKQIESIIDDMEHIKNICKIHTHSCCRYLIMGSSGFECARNSKMQKDLDERADSGKMNAVGKNCNGYKIT